ncbi:MAG: Ig-like domain repeat protein [Acidimicrobiales bacterium]
MGRRRLAAVGRAALCSLLTVSAAVAGAVGHLSPAGAALPVISATWVAQGQAPATGGQSENLNAQNNPVAGSVRAVAVSPTNANTVWVGAVNGGIWKTTNALNANPTWTPETDQAQSLSIGALDLDPTDGAHQTLVAGNGRWSSFNGTGGALAGVLRTTNGGTSWADPGSAGLSGVNISSVAPRGATIVVAATGASGGIWRSTDTGATFTRISGNGTSGLPFGSVFNMEGDPSNTNRLFAGVAGSGVFRSTDAGATWTGAGGTNFGLGTTVVNGTTSNIRVAVNPAGTALYAGVVNSGRLAGLFRSTDQGGTWTALDIPQTNEGGVTVGLQPDDQSNPDEEGPGGQGGTHFSIVADPTNANLVYLGGDRQPTNPGPDGILGNADDTFPNSIGAKNFSGRLFRCNATLATGSQCTPITHNGTANSTAPHADSRDLAFDPGGRLLETDDGGIYRQSKPSTTTGDWTSVNGNLDVTEHHDCGYDHVSHVIICGNQDTGVTEQPSQNATVWRAVTQADGGHVAADDSGASSIRYFSTQNLGGFRRRTCDAANNCANANIGVVVAGTGGKTIFQVDSPPFVTPYAINTIDPTRMVLGTGNLYESTDRGDNLTNLGSSFGSPTQAIVYGGVSGGVDNADILWLGTSSGLFLRTTNGGTISQVNAYPGGRPVDIVVDPTEWRDAWVTDGSKVFRTLDAGATWTDVTGDVGTASPGVLRSLSFIPASGFKLVALGTDTGVFVQKTTNPGGWGRLGTNLPRTLAFDLEYDATDNVLLVGTLGRGAWKLSNANAVALAAADLGVVKSSAPEPVAAGNLVTYTLTVSNAGPASAPEVIVTDTLPLGVGFVSSDAGCTADSPPAGTAQTVTCNLGVVDPGNPNAGQARTFHVTARVAAATPVGATLTNTATVDGLVADATPANNSASATSHVAKDATVIALASSAPSSDFGTGVTFTATVSPTPAPGAAAPGGAGVTFSLDGTDVATVALNGGSPGVAAFATTGIQPGSHTVGARYLGDANFNASAAGPVGQQVTCATTVSGSVPGDLTLTPGSWCLRSASVGGTLTAAAGARAYVVASVVSRDVVADGVGAFAMCGTSVRGSLTVRNATGFVAIGDPGISRCSGNTVSGTATLANNAAGAELSSNWSGAVTVTGTTGAGPFPEDAAPELEGNRVSGNLSCSGNAPAPVNDGRLNTVIGGVRTGPQCAGAF